MHITQKNIIQFLFFVFLFVTSLNLWAQANTTESFVIHFEINSSDIDPTVQNNQSQLEGFNEIIEQLRASNCGYISEIRITGYASPDGGVDFNQKLTAERCNSVYDYIQSLGLDVPIIVNNHGIAWEQLIELVEASNTPYKQDVIEVIKNTPVETWVRANPQDRWLTLKDSRNKQLMELHYGDPYRYMIKEIFPLLRTSSIVTLYYKCDKPLEGAMTPEEAVTNACGTKAIAFTRTNILGDYNHTATTKVNNIQTTPKENTLASNKSLETPKKDEHIQIKSDPIPKVYKRVPLLALKTNLLYDVLTIPNVEVEVPIGERWSVSGEWIFPWWITKNNGNALQLLSGSIEGRYWFGKRRYIPKLTGWFAGIYTCGGLYDLQFKNNGYQGEFFVAAGLAAGYSHPINRRENLRLEYSLGFGFMQTEYRYYKGMEDNKYLVWQYSGKYTYAGPTKAKISLVWLLDYKKEVKYNDLNDKR